MMKKLLSVLFALLMFGQVTPLWAGSLSIAELAVTTKVSKGKPIDAVHRISHHTVKALYCFTRTLTDEAAETTIKHVWSRGGQVIKETDLPIKGKRWRAYSSLPVDASSVGNWRVDVKDVAGTVIKSVEFRIQ
jgi:hypothetical protein